MKATRLLGLLPLLLAVGPLHAKGSDWDSPGLWTVDTDGLSVLDVQPGKGIDGLRLDLRYTLAGPGARWVQMVHTWTDGPLNGKPLCFVFRSNGAATLEVKIIDADGSNFLCRYPLERHGSRWESVVLYKDSFEYGWGGNSTLDRPVQIALAIAGTAESGTLSIDEIGLGRPGLPVTPTPDGPRLDPHRHKKGFGFAQRRHRAARPEDPRVYEWLEAVQDTASLEKQLLPSMEDNRAQTFNNALAALVFILKDDRERAERILDYYSAATVRENRTKNRQNFFYRGEPRGFFQDMFLRDSPEGLAGDVPANTDRWMGDMAWLLIAYRHYERRYDPARYAEVTRLLTQWLVSNFKPVDGGGYVQHGWRKGDTALHETNGHPEGNIDAAAALRLSGRKDLADKIDRWLTMTIGGNRLPLDLYTWRVLARPDGRGDPLSIPENDLRYRKRLRVNGRAVWGFFHSAAVDVDNIWVDGVGHMACAYYAVGDTARGHFYANQLDALLIPRVIDGRTLKALPYAANTDGGFDWVKTDRGFTSAAAWYIFAKNRFNPLTLTRTP
jgi:hypothetical protein